MKKSYPTLNFSTASSVREGYFTTTHIVMCYEK